MPDEVPAERVAVRGVLGLEILCPVLSDHLDPGLGQDPHLLWRHVLRGSNHGHFRTDLGPHALVALPNVVR
jgi:hypothetical protein